MESSIEVKKFNLDKNSMNESPEFSSFRTALKYCAAIVVLPILTLFISKSLIFDRIFKENTVPSNVWSAILAVLVLHIALGSFIYRAYSGADKVTKRD